MKYDELGCLIREYHPEGHWANLGDSCAETARVLILGAEIPTPGWPFIIVNPSRGFVRHPLLEGVDGWGIEDFSNDQFLPLMMAIQIRSMARGGKAYDLWAFKVQSPRCINGTVTLLSVGSWAILHQWFWLLNLANIVQGWLLKLSFRFGDDGKIESSKGQVQDYLNLICIYVFLKRMGKWATLPRPKDECIDAVYKYYLTGSNPEPNSTWIVDLYKKALA